MSTLKATNLQHASASSPAIVLASDSTATAQLSSLNGGALAGARNRIINGDMRIDQRNAGASISIPNTTTTYSCDRWRFYRDNSSLSVSAQQSTTAPTGFSNSMAVTINTGSAPAAGSELQLAQAIEGFNVADLGFGTASASTFTLSFWVRSSLTGTFALGLQSSGSSRAYVATYSINAANTWEYKTVVISGDTAGTWSTGNSVGLAVVFDLGGGSNFQAAAGSWTTGNRYGTSTSVKLASTTGATFYITGVQLEPGSVATPFERRSYGQELALCQRYFEKDPSLCLALPSANNGGTNRNSGFYFCKAVKRATPTVVGSGWNFEGHHLSTPTINATTNGARLEYLGADYRSAGGVLFGTVEFLAEL